MALSPKGAAGGVAGDGDGDDAPDDAAVLVGGGTGNRNDGVEDAGPVRDRDSTSVARREGRPTPSTSGDMRARAATDVESDDTRPKGRRSGMPSNRSKVRLVVAAAAKPAWNGGRCSKDSSSSKKQES